MTRLPELHRQLVEAVRRQEAHDAIAPHARTLGRGSHGARGGRDRGPRGPRAGLAGRRWRLRQRTHLLVLALAGLLASTTIALAAGGVIRIGTPVPVHKALHRESGLGVPVSGGSELVPLRVADPQGGPPWGMRIVRTSREEVCLQVGRVEDRRLGELGIDGAYRDDGELHPRPVSALPAGGTIPGASDVNTRCALAGQAFSEADLAVPSSAVGASQGRGAHPMAVPWAGALPRKELRDLYFGVLGPEAVSVTYRVGGAEHTQPVAVGSGAYLIVEPVPPSQPLDEGGGGGGAPYGQLVPGPGELLSKIAYRIDGTLCERGARWARTPIGVWSSTGSASDVAHPCPESAGRLRPDFRNLPVHLHDPVRAHLQVNGNVVTGLEISFKAPYAVSSAREQYSVFLPEKACHLKKGDVEVEGGADLSLDRNFKRGAVVSYTIPYPFRVNRLCRRRTVIVKAVYESSGESGPLRRTIVGEATVRQPPGTSAR